MCINVFVKAPPYIRKFFAENNTSDNKTPQYGVAIFNTKRNKSIHFEVQVEKLFLFLEDKLNISFASEQKMEKYYKTVPVLPRQLPL